MKKFCIVTALILLTGLSACHANQDISLTAIAFDRGHSSAWGNQLYMEVRKTEIVVLKRIAKDTGELETLEHIPIAPEQWDALEAALLHLELQEDTMSWKDRLFGGSKLDGGEYRNLSLTYSSGKKENTTKYRWPASEEANAFEALLEQLLQEVAG